MLIYHNEVSLAVERYCTKTDDTLLHYPQGSDLLQQKMIHVSINI